MEHGSLICFQEDFRSITKQSTKEQPYIQAGFPGSSPGGDSQFFFFRLFPFVSFPQTSEYIKNRKINFKKTAGGMRCVASQEMMTRKYRYHTKFRRL